MIGKHFGRWQVLRESESDRYHGKRAVCRCKCGVEKVVYVRSLTTGASTSCGCYQKERATETHKRHGHTATRTYNTWHKMIQRCNNPNEPSYKDYGGRGIKVCERWLHYDDFLKDMGKRPKTRTIDRIDNDKGYFPENCRWATKTEQSHNQRIQKRNKLGITGVRMKELKSGVIYQARITIDGKEAMLYHGPDFFEACCARKSAENKYLKGKI